MTDIVPGNRFVCPKKKKYKGGEIKEKNTKGINGETVDFLDGFSC